MRPLVNLVVARDRGVCWLCGLAGADSADHEPPRSVLLTMGVPNPDALEYLKASHILCNKRRGTRPVTPALCRELRARRLVDLEHQLAAEAPVPEPEPIVEWKAGDKVKSKQGDKLVVISQGAPGSAVHCESAEGVKPYVNTYFAAASLKKGH